MTVLDTIGPALRNIRHDRGLSQNQLARLMPCPRTYLTKIEQGRNTPNLNQIVKFARALECKPYLLVMYAELMAMAELIPTKALDGRKRPAPGIPPRWVGEIVVEAER